MKGFSPGSEEGMLFFFTDMKGGLKEVSPGDTFHLTSLNTDKKTIKNQKQSY